MSSNEVPLKVAVRLRPLVGRENPDQSCIRVQPDRKQIILGKDRAFTFDYIFPPDCSQEEVFETLCVPLIKQCFQGYNGTIFAYGQTGSGKTHTIEGNSGEEDQTGIVPRSIDLIFDEMQQSCAEGGYTYSVKVSFIEIYKEELHDLLDSENYPFKNLHIREDEKGNTTVVNAREISCSSAVEVIGYAELGATMRRTEATQMNERSSRSHSIFTLILERRDNSENDCLSSKIHFVDLAGSERASKTGNIGERFKESIHINTGLLALGNVISALSDTKRKAGHIPYRDAKITRLLKDSLGGNSNTVMITCVSPTFNNFDESLNSLKYANRAKNIRNKPIVNRDSQSMRFEALQSEIMSLKEELEREKSSKGHHHQAEDNVTQLESKLENATNNEHRLKDIVLVAKYLLEQKASNGQNEENASFVHAVECWNRGLLDARVDIPSVDSVLSSKVESLQNQVKQLTADLGLDEQIFNQLNAKYNESKAHETTLEEENHNLKQELSKCKDHIKEQQQVIMELQKIVNEQKNSVDVETNQHPDAVPRPAKSAPVRRVNDSSRFSHGDARNFHTSPSVYNMDKIVQSFRAKSQMLATQWEESDEILRDNFDDESQQQNANHKPEVSEAPQQMQRPTSNWSLRKTVPATSGKKSASASEGKRIANSGVPVQRLLKLPEINSLRASANYSKDDIDKANAQIREANKKMRELTLAIRLKEELMREMIKTEKEASSAKKALKDGGTGKEGAGDGKNLTGGSASGKKGSSNREYSNLAASIQNQAEKKVSDLTVELHKMKSQYDLVQKKLKEEMEKKSTMEKGMLANNHKVKELETKLDQQQKILKRKNEEVSAMRKSRRPNFSPNRSGNVQDVVHPGNEVEVEMEKLMQKKQVLLKMEEELKRREDLIAEKEHALQEKAHIEVKKLRASQVLSGRAMELVGKVSKLDASIDLATARGESKDVIYDLTKQRDDLLNKRDVIDEQIREGRVLGENEERKLIELEEAVEMLEAAIDFKSDQIDQYQEKIDSLEQFSEPNLLNKVYQMERDGLILLLTSYFRKVIDLKESEKSLTLQENDLMVKVDEQERIIQDLQNAVHQCKADFDRRTVDIIKEYENKTQQLLKQIQSNPDKAASGDDSAFKMLEVKVKDLERELVYYKTTSRDLKRKLRELAASGLGGPAQEERGSLASARSHLSNGTHNTEAGASSARTEILNHGGVSSQQATPRSPRTNIPSSRSDVMDSPHRRSPLVQSNAMKPPEKVMSARDYSKQSGQNNTSAPFSVSNSQNYVSVVVSKKDIREIAAPVSRVSSTGGAADSQVRDMQKDSVDD